MRKEKDKLDLREWAQKCQKVPITADVGGSNCKNKGNTAKTDCRTEGQESCLAPAWNHHSFKSVAKQKANNSVRRDGQQTEHAHQSTMSNPLC